MNAHTRNWLLIGVALLCGAAAACCAYDNYTGWSRRYADVKGITPMPYYGSYR